MKNLKELRVDYCDECMQMTNHLDDECQKCKVKENDKDKSQYDEYDEDFEDNHRRRKGYFEDDEY